MDTTLNVFLHHFPVGKLRLDDRRSFVFQYDSIWLENPDAIPLSLSLPLQTQPYEDDASRPFFSNLLPEAGIRQAVARKLGVSELNDFALLWALGGECAGAVILLPEGQNPAADQEIIDKTTLDLAASAGYYHSDNSDFSEVKNPETKYRAFHNGLVSVGFTIPFGEYISVKPMIAYSFPLSGTADDYITATSISDHSSFFYGGVTLSAAHRSINSLPEGCRAPRFPCRWP